MENKDIKTVKNIFIATFIIVVAIFILHPKNIYAVTSEVQPWCAVPLTEYNNPGGSVYASAGTIPPGTLTPSAACNSSLFTPGLNGGYCHLSTNLLSVYSTVGTLMNIPPAYLAAEKRQESGPNCLFNGTIAHGSISNIESIYYPDTNPTSPGPYQFEPSTWAGYVSGVSTILSSNFPNIYSLGINQSIFLDSMIGASIYLDSSVGVTNIKQWTEAKLLNASTKYNGGGGIYYEDPNGGGPQATAYANSVYAYYLAYLQTCNFTSS